jgi:hypothetical protein
VDGRARDLDVLSLNFSREGRGMNHGACIDCSAGQQLGCKTFCCYLLVRLDPEERNLGLTQGQDFVDKDADGCCVHLDRASHRCRVWGRRPRVCREYHCNGDFLLQVVLRQGFTGIAQLVKASAKAYIPKETFVTIPSIHK